MTALAVRWVGREGRAIGTFVHLLVTEPALLDEAHHLLTVELAALDLACSRFRADSELSQIPPGSEPVVVSRLLAEVVQAGLDTAELTGGLVDPTLGTSLRRAGYDRTFAALPEDGPTAVALPVPLHQWRQVAVREGALHLPAGVELDLGASAKAWAADRIAARVAALGTGVLVNLGGDLAMAGQVPDGGWPVAVTDRPDAGEVVQTVVIGAGALATSSTTSRTWSRGGLLMHHILDPRTGLPSPSPLASATVWAPTCLVANAFSTAAIVLGEAGPAWLEATGRPACLLRRDGTVLRLSGWPRP
jgi:thiamine biosynthesis lipoprotein